MKTVLTLDLETTNNEYGNPSYSNRVVLYATKLGNECVQAGSNIDRLADVVSNADILVAHNAKFELKWLLHHGIPIEHLEVFDTLIAEYSLLGNIAKPLDLGSVCARYGLPVKEPYIDKLMKQGICPSEMPHSMLMSRCMDDVVTTYELYKILSRNLLDNSLYNVFQTKMELCKVLADVELNGVWLDKDRVEEEFEEANTEFVALLAEIDEFTGGINPNSPKQVGEYLYDNLGFNELKNRKGVPSRTPAGGRKTDASTIFALKPTTKAQEKYLELQGRHSQLNADVTKALAKFYECSQADEIMYANFNQARTRTHRLSSSGCKHKVQFQNLHRKFKPLFTARNEGWLVAEIDGSQLEFRVAAYLGQDVQAMEDIENEVDVHTVTRDIINGAGGSVDRTGAKPHTFKPLYGGSSGTKAEQAYYGEFRRKYAGVTATQEDWKTSVINHGKLVLPTGMVFSWPNRHVNSRGYLDVSTSVCNYPVQYLATAEIIPIALVELHHLMQENDMESFIVNTVHDSVVVEVHPFEVDLLKELAVGAFTTHVYDTLHDRYGIDFNVALGVGIKVGSHWSEGDEEKYNVKPNERSEELYGQ